jgi:hypothetical protein
MTLPKAIAALRSPAQAALMKTSGEIDRIDRQLGISAWDRPAIGAWADGAENSIMTVATGATMDQLRVAGAMKGAVANQKSVLVADNARAADTQRPTPRR